MASLRMIRLPRTGLWSLLIAALWVMGCAYYGGSYHQRIGPSEIIRVSPRKARLLVKAEKAYLVCAFEKEETFHSMALVGAISLRSFRRQHPVFPSDRPVIFYCNQSGEKAAAARAAEYQNKGHNNAVVLENGVSGWIYAGFPVRDPINL